jgi:hypothetical protein
MTDFVRKVSLGDEHDVYVAQRKEGFRFFCVLMKAVGVPERKLKECTHKGFEVRDIIEKLKRKVSRWCRRRDRRKRKIFFLGYLRVGYSRLGVYGLLNEGGRSLLFETICYC